MRFKDVIEVLCALLSRVFSVLLRRRPARIVLYYHGVNKAELGNFENQMRYLANACQVVRPSEIVSVTPADSRPVVAVTFDDGLSSFFRNAFAILQKYKLPAAVAVPVGCLGRAPNWPIDGPDAGETVMDEDCVRRLEGAGIEMFSHTVSHKDLTRLGGSELDTELCESKRLLERIVGHRVAALSYPYGAYNAAVCDAAGRAGYRLGFSVEPRAVDKTANKLCIGRFKVSPADSMFVFRLKAKGAYACTRYLKLLKKALLRDSR